MTSHHQIIESLRLWQDARLREHSLQPAVLHVAKKATLDFVEGLLEQLSAFDPSLLKTRPADCLLDTAQEGAMSIDAFIAPDGRDSNNAGFYISFRPGHSFIGLGYLANTFVNNFALYQEEKLQGEELEYMLHFLTTYCGFELLTGTAPADTPEKNRRINLGLGEDVLKPGLLLKYIPHEELLDTQLQSWLTQQYKLLFSYNQYLNRALDFYAFVKLSELEDYVDLS